VAFEELDPLVVLVPPAVVVGGGDIHGVATILFATHIARLEKVLLNKSTWEKSRRMKIEELLKEDKNEAHQVTKLYPDVAQQTLKKIISLLSPGHGGREQ
jgi:hypothetical protein